MVMPRIYIMILLAMGPIHGTAWGAEIAGFNAEEVPQRMIEGTRVILEGWGCSVEAPGPDWTWVTMVAEASPAERGYSQPYYALNVGRSVPFGFYVSLHPDGANPDESYMDLLAGELRRSAGANQALIENFEYAPSEIPLPGSQRYTYSTTWADGSTWYGFGYVGGTEKKFIFSAETPSEEEPKLFSGFVGSFSLLEEPESGAGETSGSTRPVVRDTDQSVPALADRDSFARELIDRSAPGAAYREIGEEIFVQQATLDAIRELAGASGGELRAIAIFPQGVHPFLVTALIEREGQFHAISTSMYWGKVQAKFAGPVSAAVLDHLVTEATRHFECRSGPASEPLLPPALVHWSADSQLVCRGMSFSGNSQRFGEVFQPILDGSTKTYDAVESGNE